MKQMVVLLVGLALALTCPQLAKADIVVYSSPVFVTGSFENVENFSNDGAGGPGARPTGTELGNTITLGGIARDLTTVDIGLFSGGTFTVYLYGGDPSQASFLGSVSESSQTGCDCVFPSVVFDFSSLDIVLPNQVTFIVSGPISDAGILSGTTPTVGSATDSLLFGSGAGTASPTFTANSTWAVQYDGAPNNYIAAQFNAVVPEAGASTLLVAMLAGVAGLAGVFNVFKKKLA